MGFSFHSFLLLSASSDHPSSVSVPYFILGYWEVVFVICTVNFPKLCINLDFLKKYNLI